MTTLRNRPGTADTGSAAAPTVPRSRVFRDAVAAEWMKIRTLRSTYAFLAGGVAATLLGMLILFLLIQSFDQATAAEQANYETADPTVVIMPFVMFFVGSIGATLITSEFTTGSIGPGLLAVPRRRVLLAANNHPYLLSPAGAAAVMVVYVVVALGAGALSFSRRDAS